MSDVDTLTIAEFLLARIAEDEASAQAAGEPDMVEERKPSGKPTGRLVPSGETLHDYTAGLAYYEGAPDAAVEHIKRFGPARVLAECEAKRKIVAAYLDERARRDIYQSDDARAVEDERQIERRRSAAARCRGLEVAVEALASAYADHPDYRDGWRTELAR